MHFKSSFEFNKQINKMQHYKVSLNLLNIKTQNFNGYQHRVFV